MNGSMGHGCRGTSRKKYKKKIIKKQTLEQRQLINKKPVAPTNALATLTFKRAGSPGLYFSPRPDQETKERRCSSNLHERGGMRARWTSDSSPAWPRERDTTHPGAPGWSRQIDGCSVGQDCNQTVQVLCSCTSREANGVVHSDFKSKWKGLRAAIKDAYFILCVRLTRSGGFG